MNGYGAKLIAIIGYVHNNQTVELTGLKMRSNWPKWVLCRLFVDEFSKPKKIMPFPMSSTCLHQKFLLSTLIQYFSGNAIIKFPKIYLIKEIRHLDSTKHANYQRRFLLGANAARRTEIFNRPGVFVCTVGC